MTTVSGFCDFCIDAAHISIEMQKEICRTLIKYGYTTIALNTNFDDSDCEPKKKKKKMEPKDSKTDVIPLPPSIEWAKEFKDKLKILQRITIKFSDTQFVTKLNQSENLKKYHLLAILPVDNKLFQFACGSIDCDIITFDPVNRNSFKASRKMYEHAMSKGIFFEIMYGPAIKDSTMRKFIINISHMYHAYGKSKHIFISSWASHPLHVRGPYDVINLGLLFGLSEEKSKYSITETCRDLFIHAEGRRHGKAVMFVASTKNDLSKIHVKMDHAMETD